MYTGFMQEALVAHLESEQARLGLTGRAMADRIGISESNWSHIRRSRRRLPRDVFERAVVAFPGLLDVVREHSEREQVPA